MDKIVSYQALGDLFTPSEPNSYIVVVLGYFVDVTDLESPIKKTRQIKTKRVTPTLPESVFTPSTPIKVEVTISDIIKEEDNDSVKTKEEGITGAKFINFTEDFTDKDKEGDTIQTRSGRIFFVYTEGGGKVISRKRTNSKISKK